MRIIREQLADSRHHRRTDVGRGEVFRLPVRRGARGHEQRGARYAVVIQADEFLGLSTVLVSPASTSAKPTSFRPSITFDGTDTRVLVEQTTVVDPQRLGTSAGRLDTTEVRASTRLSRSASVSNAQTSKSP